jgi:predicted outer membrane repeat protein
MTSTIRPLYSAMARRLAFATALLSMAVCASAGQAATITVGGACTVRNAVTSINNGSNYGGCAHSGTYGSSDTVMVPVGTFNLNSTANITRSMTIHGGGKWDTYLQATSLLVNYAINVSNPSIVVKMDNLFLGGTSATMGILVNGEGDTNLNDNNLELNLVVVAGFGDTGIRSEGARVLIQNTLIYENSGIIGGGVANTNVQNDNGTWTFGTFVSKNSAISFNYAAGYGGGIFNTGKMDLRSTLFQDNQTAHQGGAIWVDTIVNGTTCNVTRDTPSSARSEFEDNTADQGYGIISSSVPCSLHDSIGAGNSSPYC